MFKPKPLPWPVDSFPGFMSPEQIQIHYDKFYLKYYDNINSHYSGPLRIEELLTERLDLVGDYARQIWNHEFFWNVISPNPRPINGMIYQVIIQQYQSVDKFKTEFNRQAKELFGSGWIWLVYDPSISSIYIQQGPDSHNPLQDGLIPLLTLDVWEHAYIYDWTSDRVDYARNFWRYVDWDRINLLMT